MLTFWQLGELPQNKGASPYDSANRGQIVTWTVIGCQCPVQCSAAELWLAAE